MKHYFAISLTSRSYRDFFFLAVYLIAATILRIKISLKTNYLRKLHSLSSKIGGSDFLFQNVYYSDTEKKPNQESS